MYSVDEKDEVVKLENVPPSSVGAPMPIVLADDRRVLLCYFVQEREFWQDGTAEDIAFGASEEAAALVEFTQPRTHLFGSPNDEALHGHPLYERGLRQYGAYEVRHSSSVRELERLNRVHSGHAPERFARLRHYIFTFHDSTFECVAEGLQATEYRGAMRDVLAEMQRRMGSS